MHLAELHERARELGIPRYRMLTRRELLEALEEQMGEKPRKRRERKPRARAKPVEAEETRPAKGDEPPAEEEDEEEVETQEVTGVLDRMPQGYGFLRLSGLEPADGDVYVSASQIRRCELRPGDDVRGPAREPRRGERHRALVRVESVNDGEPEGERTAFEDLTSGTAERPLRDPDIAYGQRVLVLAGDGSAATATVREIAEAAASQGAKLSVVLVGEPLEAVADWEKALPDAELYASREREPREHVRSAELAMAHAKRRAQTGADALVVIDSLSALAVGYRDPSRVKRLVGSARELEEEGTGSLTVIATVIEGDERAEDVRDALEGAEDVLVQLESE